MTKASPKTRPIAVQLSPQTIEQLDRLADKSGVSRHKYMVLVLERAVSQELWLRKAVTFVEGKPANGRKY